jgi:hypothetical protein
MAISKLQTLQNKKSRLLQNHLKIAIFPDKTFLDQKTPKIAQDYTIQRSFQKSAKNSTVSHLRQTNVHLTTKGTKKWP